MPGTAAGYAGSGWFNQNAPTNGGGSIGGTGTIGGLTKPQINVAPGGQMPSLPGDNPGIQPGQSMFDYANQRRQESGQAPYTQEEFQRANQPGGEMWNSGINGGRVGGMTGGIQPAGGAAAGGGDWIGDALAAVQSTDDPNYWRQQIAAHGNDMTDPSKRDYWIDRINRGDGSSLVKSGQLSKVDGPAGGGAAGGGYNFATDDPSYGWVKEQGLKSLDALGAANGTALSGGHLKDAMRYGAGLASSEYSNAFGRKATVANMGLQAAGIGAQTGSAYGANSSNLATGQGNANAAGTMAGANAAAAGGLANAEGNADTIGGLVNAAGGLSQQYNIPGKIGSLFKKKPDLNNVNTFVGPRQ